jgi:dTMP kinase
MPRGIFITLEGGEGAGKSTLQKTLARRFKKAGYKVVLSREPGGTKLGRRLRRELLNGGHVYPAAELLLYAADRAQHVAEVIEPAIKAGSVVICDRFSDSTVAYQGYGRKLDRKTIADLNALAQQGITPQVTLWLDLPVSAGLARTRKRGAADRLEAEKLAFHERVRTGFRAVAKANPERVVKIDASKGIEQVADAAVRALRQRLKLNDAF